MRVAHIANMPLCLILLPSAVTQTVSLSVWFCGLRQADVSNGARCFAISVAIAVERLEPAGKFRRISASRATNAKPSWEFTVLVPSFTCPSSAVPTTRMNTVDSARSQRVQTYGYKQCVPLRQFAESQSCVPRLRRRHIASHRPGKPQSLLESTESSTGSMPTSQATLPTVGELCS